jgi:hypothetical protein
MSLWQKIGLGAFIAAFLWLAGTNAIFQLSNPEVTQTQALLHLPRTVTLDFTP